MPQGYMLSVISPYSIIISRGPEQGGGNLAGPSDKKKSCGDVGGVGCELTRAKDRGT